MLPHDFLADLPAPRDDEPLSLRDDIADELADHLHCALRRELLKDGDETTAERRVLDRFGDARKLARRLWWQAMWSRVMGQRIVSGVQWVLTLAAVALAGAVFWQQSTLLQEIRLTRNQDAADRSTLMALIDQLRQPKPRPADQEGAAPEPVAQVFAADERFVEQPQSLTVTLVEETADGPRVLEAKLSMGELNAYPEIKPKKRFTEHDGQMITLTSQEETGRYVFQLHQPDRCELNIRLPDGQSCQRSVLVRANEHHELTVICPKPREKAMVFLTAPPLPKDLQALKGELEIQLDDSITTIDGVDWYSTGGHRQLAKFDAGGGPIVVLRNDDTGSSIDLRQAKPDERAVVLLTGPVRYSYSLQPASWPEYDKPVTRLITPGENHWELELPEELLANVRSIFISLAPYFPAKQGDLLQAAENPPLGDKSRLIVILTSETKDGPPLRKGSLTLSDRGRLQSPEYHPDDKGRCMLGPTNPGRYQLHVALPGGTSTQKSIILRPGQERTEHIVCPALATGATILITLPSVPEDLRSLHLRLRLDSQPVTLDGRSWETPRATDQLGIALKDGLLTYINGSDVEGEAPEDRLLFVPTGSYSMKLDLLQPNPNGEPEGSMLFVRNVEHQLDFEARHGENKWEIKLPDEFWDKARKELRNQKSDPQSK